jgi:hypothetical protein
MDGDSAPLFEGCRYGGELGTDSTMDTQQFFRHLKRSNALKE